MQGVGSCVSCSLIRPLFVFMKVAPNLFYKGTSNLESLTVSTLSIRKLAIVSLGTCSPRKIVASPGIEHSGSADSTTYCDKVTSEH